MAVHLQSSFFTGLLSKSIPATIVIPSRTPDEAISQKTLIFVVGCPRSGTTLLGRTIGAHPDICSGDETLFLTYLYDMFYELVLGKGDFPSPGLAHVKTADFIDACGTFADKMLIRDPTRTHHLDHTPWYGAMAPLLRALYPECWIIHVIRDGTQVVNSLRTSFERGHEWAGSTTAQRASLWVSMVEKCQMASSLPPIDRYMEVRYEDFVTAPRQLLRVILNDLGLPWADATLKPLSEPHASPSRKNWKSAQPTTGFEGWSRSDVQAFEEIAGALQLRLGYDNRQIGGPHRSETK